MTPDIVADIGNTRIKWGLCGPDGVAVLARLTHAPDMWDECLTNCRQVFPGLGTDRPLRWAIAGVVPGLRDTFRSWTEGCGGEALLLDSYKQLPIKTCVDVPERVGMDRLLNAVAARFRSPGRPAVLVDVGSAVTVDWMDETGVFFGGAIFPGVRLMAGALHESTAALPQISVPELIAPPPAGDTVGAMQTGIAWAIAGGVFAIARHYGRSCPERPEVFLTGGDAEMVARVLMPWTSFDESVPSPVVWPKQTLEGIRVAAAAFS